MTKKSNSSIRLSKKYGVNPSILHCSVCGKETGIALLGKLKGDMEAPRDMYNDLCEDCKKYLDSKGTIIIEVKGSKEENENKEIERTGRIAYIKTSVENLMGKIVCCSDTDFQEIISKGEKDDAKKSPQEN